MGVSIPHHFSPCKTLKMSTPADTIENMDIRIAIIIIFLVRLLLNGLNVYAGGSHDENPNEISDYYKRLIETGEMKPLVLLETIDKEKYDLVIKHLSEDDKIEDYYYHINISVILDEKTKKYFTPEEYQKSKELPEYKGCEIERIEYAIWYYEAFFNKYSSWNGDPTGKCFSIIFNENYEFVRKVRWK